MYRTAPFIYFIEKNEKYFNMLRPIFSEIDAGGIEALTSTITLLEVLVMPFRNQNQALVEKYREILLYAEGLTTYEVLHEVSELSSKLRAQYSIRTPDAIQITVGLTYGADVFLTNDSDSKKVNDISILSLFSCRKKQENGGTIMGCGFPALNTITTFNIRARYDDYKMEFHKKCSKEFTGKWVKNIEEMRKWIKNKLLK